MVTAQETETQISGSGAASENRVLPETTGTEAAEAGAMTIEVASTAGMNVGDNIIIGAGTETEETNQVADFGSIVLRFPLQFDQPAGVTISVVSESIDFSFRTPPKNSKSPKKSRIELCVRRANGTYHSGHRFTVETDCRQGVFGVNKIFTAWCFFYELT